MKSTVKTQCVQTARVLSAHGVRHAVLCPGSRNLPLINAFALTSEISCRSIVDERSAAFFALGMAQNGGSPVAVVCTSGSALLNFAPAVAEAYYKKLPLIVISADRPQAWIDQQDSQTLRQPGALSNIVKGTFTLPEGEAETDLWFANRQINEAALTALEAPAGPVHINVPLSLPLNKLRDYGAGELEALCRVIRLAPVEPVVDKEFMRQTAIKFQTTKKILIVAGGMAPSHALTRSLARLASRDNVVVMSENLSNLHLPHQSRFTEALAERLDGENTRQLQPQLLVTFGDAVVSSQLKQWLRSNPRVKEHWHVGEEPNIVDTYMCLTTKFRMSPANFFLQLRRHMRASDTAAESNYQALFSAFRDKVEQEWNAAASSSGWCDLGALDVVVRQLPADINLQLSNGMSVRLAMRLAATFHFHRADCNRGVSGIDGSTSTALGAATRTERTTVLVSGDMSACYDAAAFQIAPRLTRNFKMLVIANGGGDIFRHIAQNEDPRVANDYLTAGHAMQVDIAAMARACGWATFEARSYDELHKNCGQWFSRRTEPSLLICHTAT